MARVPTEATPSLLSVQNPFTIWTTAVNPTPLDGLGTWLATANDPVATPGQHAPAYLYALGFGFSGSAASGLVALGVGPTGKVAAFTVSETGRDAHTAVIPFAWNADRFYFPFVYRLGEGLWGAWVFDHAVNNWVPIGALALPAAWGRLAPVGITAAVWVGSPVPQCSSLPLADVFFFQPIGYVGTSGTYMGSTDRAGVTPGNCATQTTIESEGLVRNRVGTS